MSTVGHTVTAVIFEHLEPVIIAYLSPEPELQERQQYIFILDMSYTTRFY